VLWGLGVPALLNHTLNICHITAAAVVFGLCVDYGIYMTHAIATRAEKNGRTTIVLTTATSIIGAGVLLFTQHPVLFAIGVTLTVGMLAGHITAIWAVPALVALWGDKGNAQESTKSALKKSGSLKSQTVLVIALLASSFGSSAFASGIVEKRFAPTPTRYEAVSSVVMQYRWFKFPALGVISVDTRKHNFALVGLSQIGINVCELSEKDGVVKSRMPGKLLERSPKIAMGAAADVSNMFFDLVPAKTAMERDGGDVRIYSQPSSGGTLEYRFDKQTHLLMEKRFSVPRKYWLGSTVVWVVSYDHYAKSSRVSFPQTIRFKHRGFHYAITTFVKEMRIK